MKIYFVTNNKTKIKESNERLKRFVDRVDVQEWTSLDIKICPVEEHLDELLDINIERIVWKKVIEAYRIVHLPCVVEHGGLFLDAWGGSAGFPGGNAGLLGGIGQIVWDAVGERMCGFLQEKDERGAEAHSVIGYCEGRHVRVYSGTTRGEVTKKAKGDRGFRWDPIFMPTGYVKTYGQMTPEEKRETSPDEIAWEKFFQDVKADFLKTRKK